MDIKGKSFAASLILLAQQIRLFEKLDRDDMSASLLRLRGKTSTGYLAARTGCVMRRFPFVKLLNFEVNTPQILLCFQYQENIAMK